MNAKILLRLISMLAIITSPGFLPAQQSSFIYVCPAVGSYNLNPEQNIILKHTDGFNPATISTDKISVSGSHSGLHSCLQVISDDYQTIIFKPVIPFALGEKVSVIYSGGFRTSEGIELKAMDFDFHIINHDRDEINKFLAEFQPEESKDFSQISVGQSVIASYIDNNLPPDYPAPTVYNYGQHDNEYIFLNLGCWNAGLPWKNYLTIIDSYGTPVYYDRNIYNRNNFYKLPNGLLCYGVNLLANGPEEKYYLMDGSFTVVDSVNTGNGYILDAHDMLLLDNGHYLVMSYDPQVVDMSVIVPGGDPGAIVTGLVIQEVDNQENVFFQWRSWDYFEITDATDDINLQAHNIDYVHGNAFEIDNDGNILLSSRHLDEITKINFNSGNVMWRFGQNSENNMFQISNDPIGFSYQHDIRLLPDGHYTVFDNGNLNSPQITRALEYEINQNTLTASLIWDYQHPSQIYAGSAGSFRTLSNGNKIIGWGGTYPITASVIDEDQSMLQEVYLPSFVNSYRAFKTSWETTLFSTQNKLSMGNYAGYDGLKQNKLYIFNNSNQVVTISSIHHHSPHYEIITPLPISIFPGASKSVDIGFYPSAQGDYDDRFTLNFDNPGNTRRIARQLQVQGYNDEAIPSVFFDPAFGSTNVAPETEIIITFDEPVMKVFGGEITNEDIPSLVLLKEVYFNGTDIPFQGTINEDKTMITIVPGQTLAENLQYYVKLKGNTLLNYNENIIKLDEECYFQTGVTTGLEEALSQQVHVFPNPVSDILSVTNPDHAKKEFFIYNAAGQLIFYDETDRSMIQFDISSYAAGIYYVGITDVITREIKVQKIIKH